MGDVIERHVDLTRKLAGQLRRGEIFTWLVQDGYYPEAYVLPPSFVVTQHPSITTKYWDYRKTKSPKTTVCQEVHFPRSELTDRTFGIIDPEIHCDISREIAWNWKKILSVLFAPRNLVACYSFPVPVSSRSPGEIGSLRSGRMIYEWITMAEKDIAEVAYGYRYLLKTDVKNFYPSLYTHSIAWALHGKKFIRKGQNRWKLTLVGNRLDKLFQSANDGCTNGVPIGPAVSDIAAELVLAAVDQCLSVLLRERGLVDQVRIVRFKDDYRLLAKTESEGRIVLKLLQKAMKEYRLELSDDKTEWCELPDGLFREWRQAYDAVNPNPRGKYDFRRFSRVYMGVVRIDREMPGTGIIDRFLNDLITKDYKIRISGRRTVARAVSLLLLLGHRRTKAFPTILGIIGALLDTRTGREQSGAISDHLHGFLGDLRKQEDENRYLIAWIIYFLRSRGIYQDEGKKQRLKDPVVRALHTSRFSAVSSPDFKLFVGVRSAAKKTKLLEYLSTSSGRSDCHPAVVLE